MNVVLKTRMQFFDRDRVRRVLAARERQVLSRFGATTMRIAQRMMPYRDGPAPPGKPPHAHQGLLREGATGVQFAYDLHRRSVVIGPIDLGRGVPLLLEMGGVSTRWGKPQVIEPHPYMAPAFAKAQERLPQLWRARAFFSGGTSSR